MTEETANAGRKRWRHKLRAWLPAIAYMAVIFVLSAQSDLPASFPFHGGDKAAHAVIYLGLALLVFRSTVRSPLAGYRWPYVQSFVLAVLYGVTDEFHQKFVPGRTMDVIDWLSDIAGVLLALILIAVLRKPAANGGKEIGKVQKEKR